MFILAFRLAIGITALFKPKAKEWIEGRNGQFASLQASISPSEKVIWMHCASAGELEQGKPVAEDLKKRYPDYKILITFFSPSGFAVGKKFKAADYVFYLPLDTKKNARRFIQIVQPKLVIFVKYDFWFHHLKSVNQQGIPLLLISAIFRKEQAFFKWYGGFFKRMLRLFTLLFVQDETSLKLLHSIQVNNTNIAGDTRFDRVLSIAENNKKEDVSASEIIKVFIGNSPVIVAGSTWPDDEKLLSEGLKKRPGIKLIIVPHEITEEHLRSIEGMFPQSVRYSRINDATYLKEITKGIQKRNNTSGQSDALKNRFLAAPVLIIDGFGMLSRLYQYATVTYIGGGFNKSGIHNTLEAAVWSKPVLCGPNYKKFKEARELLATGAAFSIATATELEQVIDTLFEGFGNIEKSGRAAGMYVRQNGGATKKILDYIQENRLLTTA